MFVGIGQHPFESKLTNISNEKVGWFRNFFRFRKEFMLTLWLKMISKPDNPNNFIDRSIIWTELWEISYNHKNKVIRWNIGIKGDRLGRNFALECSVPDIKQWTYFTFAANGVGLLKGLPGIAKQYVDGELC